MKQSHHMLCEVVPIHATGSPEAVRDRLQREIQLYLHGGWTLRAAPVVGEFVHLVFVCKVSK